MSGPDADGTRPVVRTARALRLRRLETVLGVVTVTLAVVLGVGLAVTFAPPMPLDHLSVTVTGVGYSQADVDACKGPVLWEGSVIVEHNYCGGKAWLGLQAGGIVTLTGDAIKAGTYRVASVKTIRSDTAVSAAPYPYVIQTCVDTTSTRYWYLQPV